MKILVVDDEPFQLRLLERQLRNLGCDDILSFQSAEDALATLREELHGVDLVLCDLQMPGMDGVELVRHLHESQYRGSVVLVSGEDERILLSVERLAQAHHLRVLGALRKPVEPARLAEMLKRHRALARPDTDATPRPAYTADQLWTAIAGGQLVNHYQPKVALSTGTVVGVEALVRWQHPRDGLVPPDLFIPVAERSGQIDDLTQVVLAEALEQARHWRDEGRLLKVAVNVSMQSLSSLSFADLVIGALNDAAVPPASLVLEVTETSLMQDPRAPLDILNRMRLKRIGLSIDDFGTGNASLAQLRDIPFDELKIDRSFVHGAGSNRLLRAIVEASLGMARQLGITTVAEGLEDRADWDFLRAAGCDLGQGWFIGRPMPVAELPAWEAAWEARRPGLLLPAAV